MVCGPPQGSLLGDPCSPSLLANVLEPWSRIVASFDSIQPFLYMDDRSLPDCSVYNSLARALQASRWFEDTLMLKELQGKRQVWDRTALTAGPVEHLGVTTVPGTAALPLLRTSADDMTRFADAVLLGLVLPKLTWAAPLIPVVSDQVTRAFYLAIGGLARGGAKVVSGLIMSRCILGSMLLFSACGILPACWFMGALCSRRPSIITLRSCSFKLLGKKLRGLCLLPLVRRRRLLFALLLKFPLLTRSPGQPFCSKCRRSHGLRLVACQCIALRKQAASRC